MTSMPNPRTQVLMAALSAACMLSATPGLLAAGADLRLVEAVQRQDGEAALLLASRAGGVDVVRALLARGADVAAKTSRGFTSLIFAAAEGHATVAGVLVETGADLSARTDAIIPKARARYSAQERPEPRRLRKNQALLITQLTQDGDADPRRPQGGFTPLLYAAMAGDLDTVRLLVAAGADVNDAAPDGVTPLVLTLTRGIEEGLWRLSAGRNEDIAVFLLERGADPSLAEAGYTGASGGGLEHRPDLRTLLLESLHVQVHLKNRVEESVHALDLDAPGGQDHVQRGQVVVVR